MRSSDATAPGRRVLYLITSDISARFLRGQLEHLIRHGYRITVGTARSVPPAELDPGVAVHEIGFAREPHPVADARALWQTVRLIRHTKPAIVNASTPKAGLLGMLAARLCRVPRRVYVVRGLRFETMTGTRRRVFRLVERVATGCATDVVYNSASLRTVAVRERTVRARRGVVLGAGSGNGIDVDRFRVLPSRSDARAALGLPADARVVGFVGRLTRDKGIVDLVEALGAVDDDRLRLLLVGDYEAGDPVPDATRAAIATSPRIVHVPWTDDTRGAYRAMDVLAFPSYREGLPNVPLEAQLCGVPVVAYGATGTVDAVAPGVTGVLVPVGDRDRMVVAVTEILADDALRSRMAEAGPGWVADRFRQDLVWSQLEALYSRPAPR